MCFSKMLKEIETCHTFETFLQFNFWTNFSVTHIGRIKEEVLFFVYGSNRFSNSWKCHYQFFCRFHFLQRGYCDLWSLRELIGRLLQKPMQLTQSIIKQLPLLQLKLDFEIRPILKIFCYNCHLHVCYYVVFDLRNVRLEYKHFYSI